MRCALQGQLSASSMLSAWHSATLTGRKLFVRMATRGVAPGYGRLCYFAGTSSRVFTSRVQNLGMVLIWQRSLAV